MTIKKFMEQLVIARFKDEDVDLALKLARATGKNEIRDILDEFTGDAGD